MLEHFSFIGLHLVMSHPVFVSFRCLWSMMHSYKEFVCRKTKVWIAACTLIKKNCTNRAITPECILIEPNLPSVNKHFEAPPIQNKPQSAKLTTKQHWFLEIDHFYCACLFTFELLFFVYFVFVLLFSFSFHFFPPIIVWKELHKYFCFCVPNYKQQHTVF